MKSTDWERHGKKIWHASIHPPFTENNYTRRVFNRLLDILHKQDSKKHSVGKWSIHLSFHLSMVYISILLRNGIWWNVILPCLNSQHDDNYSDYVREMKTGRMMGSWRWQNLILYHMRGTSLCEPALVSSFLSMYLLHIHPLPPISSHYLPSFVEAYPWAS
jgi:hypothetical protein